MKHIKLFLITAVSTLCFAPPAMSDATKKQTIPPTTVLTAETGATMTAPARPSLNAFSQSATPLPIQGIIDRLPSIKVYHQQNARSTVVARVNCPLTVATGMVPMPTEMLFEALDKVTFALNEKEFFKYDVKFVCG